ncbi:FecR family protein [Sphingomonas oryzagri]
MDRPDEAREQLALDWVRRIADPDFADWNAHLEWLETDARNAEAFDRLSLAMETAADGLPPAGRPPAPQIANDNDVSVRQRSWRIGASAGGLVAAALLALLVWPHQAPIHAGTLFATAPGAPRDIVLTDGTRLALNGASRVRIEDDRSVALLDGEAYFQVVHHADRPFRVRIGERVIQDVGTAFDVSRMPQATKVSVREGAVAIDPDDTNVRLAAGQEARIGDDGRIERATVPQDHAIGGWREGRLVYQEASWTEVGIDLTRALGVPVSLSPAMVPRRFTGSIMVDRDPARTIRRVADVANLSAVPEGRGWRLAPR